MEQEANILLNSAAIAAVATHGPAVLAPPLSPLKSATPIPPALLQHPSNGIAQENIDGTQHSSAIPVIPNAYPIPISTTNHTFYSGFTGSPPSQLFLGSTITPNIHITNPLLNQQLSTGSMSVVVQPQNVAASTCTGAGAQNIILQSNTIIPSLPVVKPAVSLSASQTFTSELTQQPVSETSSDMSAVYATTVSGSSLLNYAAVPNIPILSTTNATVFPASTAVTIASEPMNSQLTVDAVALNEPPSEPIIVSTINSESSDTIILPKVSTAIPPSSLSLRNITQLMPPASLSITSLSSNTSSPNSAKMAYAAPTPTLAQKPPPQPSLCYTHILLGEITALLAAMRRATPRWSQHQNDSSQDPLVSKLRELQAHITSLSTNPDANPPSSGVFLEPFLAVIRSDDTTGPVTKCALASVNRMLCYGLVSPASSGAAAAAEEIAGAVTHARFVGTDQAADEVVLWEILTVLKTLLLGPVGHLLTNEAVCELLNSSFRICFETRLSELLRNCTEDALRQMVALLFSRLPQFSDEPTTGSGKRLKMKTGPNTDSSKSGKKSKTSKLLQRSHSPSLTHSNSTVSLSDKKKSSSNDDISKGDDSLRVASVEGDKVSTDAVPSKDAVQNTNSNADATSIDSGITDPSLRDSRNDLSNTHLTLDNQHNQGSLESIQSPVSDCEAITLLSPASEKSTPGEVGRTLTLGDSPSSAVAAGEDKKQIFVNSQGVKFTAPEAGDGLVPYGMACVREVLRFLVSLTSPTYDQNTPTMIATALGLVTVALEVGGEHINSCPSLLMLIRDQLCRNLLLLLKAEVRLPILMVSLRVCVLVFESLRTHVKFQLEMFMTKLTDIITLESPNMYSHKELALETVVQLWRIPGLITELFVNFDCELYSDNIFEDLTKILSKNAYPEQGLYSTNLLSLDALLTVIDTLDSHSLFRQKSRSGSSTAGEDSQKQDNHAVNGASKRSPGVVAPASSGYLLGVGLLSGFSPVTPTLRTFTVLKDREQLLREHLLAVKEKKKLLATGTDQFNVKPEKGIQFLQDNGILGTSNEDIAYLVRENPKLDKKMIGEYVSKKKNVGILSAFVRSFEFAGLRIDQCLRTFLETFRLPGEAPVISIIIEHFSSHWHTSNNEPFAKEDAAFTLAYAVIMLNVDQHNQNAKKQNVPMTLIQFRNNLRGVNDGNDFDPDMLEEIYNAICKEEIIMPAEQSGLVKENYLWKMLLKRGATKEGKYMLANDDRSFDRDLFTICWGPTVASLSYVFHKSDDDGFIQKALSGFKKCASISARYGMSDVFDNLVVSLCKFSGLTPSVNGADIIAIDFGSNGKSQLAAMSLFKLVILHGDILRDGWKNVVEVLLQLFRCRLLPATFTQSPDLLEGNVSLYRPSNSSPPRVEPSLLSSLYSYIALGDAGNSRGSSPEDEQCRERAKKCILDCHIEKLIKESAFLRHDALSDMLKALMSIGDGSCLVGGGREGPTGDGGAADGDTLDEYGHALLLEMVVEILIANKDRALCVWPRVHDYVFSLMMTAASSGGKDTRHEQQRTGQAPAAPLSVERVWLLQRCVAALLRMAAVLVRRPDLSSVVLQSCTMLLLLHHTLLPLVALQMVAGVHELLTLTADHITHSGDWAVVFTLLEAAGAGAKPPATIAAAHHHSHSQLLHMRSLPDSEVGSSSGPDSGHCSEVGSGNEADHEGRKADDAGPARPAAAPAARPAGGGWIMVCPEGGETSPPGPQNEWDIVQQRAFWPGAPSPEAIVRSVDTLAFLVRERHMTAASLPHAVQAARTFVEATLHGGRAELQQQQHRAGRGDAAAKSPQRRRLGGRRREDRAAAGAGSSSGGAAGSSTARPAKTERKSAGAGAAVNAYDADESDSDDVPATLQQVSEKLLDLLDTLHTSAGSVMASTGSKSPRYPPDIDSSEIDISVPTSVSVTSAASLTAEDVASSLIAAPSDEDKQKGASSDINSGVVIDSSSTDIVTADTAISTVSLLSCNSSENMASATTHQYHSGAAGLPESVAAVGGSSASLDLSSRSVLWTEVLCPLLQAIARYCCDARPRVRHLAMTYLQRALLNHDLQTLDAHQWEACFNKVLFPLLSALLATTPGGVLAATLPGGAEESRLRAATLVQKVYLRHLTTLLTLPTFTALWLTILDFLDSYLNTNTSDHLSDAVPEILKNMLLVMETTQVFHTSQGFTRLWSVTWDRVDSFLPGFRTELFKSHPPSKIHRIDVVADAAPSAEGATGGAAPQQEVFMQSATSSVHYHPTSSLPSPNASSALPNTSYPQNTAGVELVDTVISSSNITNNNINTDVVPAYTDEATTVSSSAVPPITSFIPSIPSQQLNNNRERHSLGADAAIFGAGAALAGGSMSDDETRRSSSMATFATAGDGASLDAQTAARLSLSQECLPSYLASSSLILQPPLPPSETTPLVPHAHPITPILPSSLESIGVAATAAMSLHQTFPLQTAVPMRQTFNEHAAAPLQQPHQPQPAFAVQPTLSSHTPSEAQVNQVSHPLFSSSAAVIGRPSAAHLFRANSDDDPFTSLSPALPQSGV